MADKLWLATALGIQITESYQLAPTVIEGAACVIVAEAVVGKPIIHLIAPLGRTLPELAHPFAEDIDLRLITSGKAGFFASGALRRKGKIYAARRKNFVHSLNKRPYPAKAEVGYRLIDHFTRLFGRNAAVQSGGQNLAEFVNPAAAEEYRKLRHMRSFFIERKGTPNLAVSEV